MKWRSATYLRLVERFVPAGEVDALLRRGAAGAFVVQVVGTGVAFVTQVIVARVLRPGDYGTYVLVLAWVNALAAVALLGHDTGVVRLLPRYEHEARWDAARGLLWFTRAAVLAASAAVAVLCAVALHGYLEGRGTQGIVVFLIGAGLVASVAQLQLSAAFHRALRYAIASGVFFAIIRPVILVALVGLPLLIAHYLFDVSRALLANLIATLGALAASDIMLRRHWPAGGRSARPHYEAGYWTRLDSQFLLTSIILVGVNRVDLLVLGFMASPDAAGPYFAAVQIASLAGYGLTSMNVILAPVIAQKFAAGDHDELNRIVHRSAWIVFLVTAAISIVLAIGGIFILRLFGPRFAVAYGPLLIMLFGQFVNAATGPVGYLMTMTRFERVAPLVFGGGAIANLLLSVTLIPVLGISGAAIASSLSTIGWNVAALVIIRRSMNINPTILPLEVQ